MANNEVLDLDDIELEEETESPRMKLLEPLKHDLDDKVLNNIRNVKDAHLAYDIVYKNNKNKIEKLKQLISLAKVEKEILGTKELAKDLVKQVRGEL